MGAQRAWETAGGRVVWAGATVLAGVGTAIAYAAEPGANWGIWTTLAAAGLLALARRRRASPWPPGERIDGVAGAAAALAVIVAWGAALTADELFQLLVLVTVVLALAVAARVLGGLPGRSVGAATMAAAPVTGLGYALLEAGRRSAEGATRLHGQRTAPVVRGLTLALPIAGVFALVLAGADPTLTIWRDATLHAIGRLDGLPRLVFFLSLGALTLGAYGLADRGSGAEGVDRGTRRPPAIRLGAVEQQVITYAIVVIVGVFLAVQASYLFRDVGTLRLSGMSYAEYAHRGFTELTIAATMTVLLIVGLEYARAPGRETERRSATPTLVLIGEVLVVLASAFHRLTLYEAAHGYTTLRVQVQAYIVGVGLALVLVASEVAGLGGALRRDVQRGRSPFDPRRLARRTAAAAALLVAGFSYANTEAWVVSQNIARYRETGSLDARYLTDALSLDAAPATVAALAELPPPCAAWMRERLDRRYGRAVLRRADRVPRWFEWNLRRERGLAALRGAGIVTRAGDRGEGPDPCEAPPTSSNAGRRSSGR